MQPTIYPVELIGSGRLAMMARPRADDWAADEFAGLAALGVTDIVSLLESQEAKELGLEDEASFCATAGMRFHTYPIPDRGVPRSIEGLSRLSCHLYHSCAGGNFAVVHCRAGIGRAGLVCAAVLLHCGYAASEALSAISRARGVRVPDTIDQHNWLVINESRISACHQNE